MSATVSVANFRRFLMPAQTVTKPEAQNELASAIAALKAIQTIPAELANLDQEKAADDALLQEIQARQLQRGERRRDIDRRRANESHAKSVILRATTTESDEESALTDFGRQKQRESGELQSRYRIFVAKMLAPEETDDHKQLQSLLEGIAECDAMIKRQDNPDRHPGVSAAENRRRQLQRDASDLQPKVDAYARLYAQWREIQDARGEAEAAFAKRDELRTKREDAAIAAALKGK